jgi:bifunctional ADP-heptose synthase (sugar kinase/adenylyltransferase)
MLNKNKIKCLVIGEHCIDKFIYGKTPRLNPESPTPVFIPGEIKENPGMAGNVMENLKYFECDVDLICQKFTKIKKTRYVDEKSNYILLRVDEHDNVSFGLEEKDLPDLKQYDFVIVSDYNKGFLSESIMNYIFKNSSLSFLDTKKTIKEWAADASFIKINEKEYHENIKDECIINDDKLIITLGEKGAMYKNEIIKTDIVDTRDVAGAGDTFISVLAIEYFKTKNIKHSIQIANKYATKACLKKGVVSNFNF